jgi:uncharacterized protein YdeI (YjbR/CyaY-like superfamily)
MSDATSKVETFLAEARWREELEALRAILLASPLTEDFKWRAPCYTFGQGNVAALWGLKDGCAVAFFKGVLLKDPQGLLVAPGENSRAMRRLDFRSLAEIAAREEVLKAYLHEAVEVEKAGRKVEFPKDDLAYPEELRDALAEDAGLGRAFEALTPGRRRGYLLHFSRAKQSKTRRSRIEKAAPRILAGKGPHDR